MADENAFHPDLIYAIFRHLWTQGSHYRKRNEGADEVENKGLVGSSKKARPLSANANAIRLSSELLRIFVEEAVQRAATIAEAEGLSKIEASHLERILPQLLMDF